MLSDKERLFRLLEAKIDNGSSPVVLAIYPEGSDSTLVLEQTARSLHKHFTGLTQYKAEAQIATSLLDQLGFASLSPVSPFNELGHPSNRKIIHVLALEEMMQKSRNAPTEQEKLLQRIDCHRENFFTEVKGIKIFWISDRTASQLFIRAPNFMSWKSGLYNMKF